MGAQFAPKLPDSCSRKGGGEQNSLVSMFGRRGQWGGKEGREAYLNGHLSWTEIPEELILWPSQQTSGTRNSSVISRDAKRFLHTRDSVRVKRQRGKKHMKVYLEENLARL